MIWFTKRIEEANSKLMHCSNARLSALLAGEIICEYSHDGNCITILLTQPVQQKVSIFLQQMNVLCRQTRQPRMAGLCSYQDLSARRQDSRPQQFRESPPLGKPGAIFTAGDDGGKPHNAQFPRVNTCVKANCWNAFPPRPSLRKPNCVHCVKKTCSAPNAATARPNCVVVLEYLN